MEKVDKISETGITCRFISVHIMHVHVCHRDSLLCNQINIYSEMFMNLLVAFQWKLYQLLQLVKQWLNVHLHVTNQGYNTM